MSVSYGLSQTARLSCTACRKQKRKCSRSLPSCILCRKNRRTCEYPPEAVSVSDTEDGSCSVSNLSIRNEFPRIFFLDSYLFRRQNISVPIPFTDLPEEYSEIIQGNTQLKATLNSYFVYFHPYFPFISKLQCQRTIGHLNTTERPADFVLQLATIQLITTSQADLDAIMGVYGRVKHFASYLQARGIISVRLLQAHLLIALFEVCHAIYPAAYMTVGQCAQLGHAIGIHNPRNATQIMAPTSSWTEMEEQRRTWWAVRVIDRYANIGLGRRPFACEDAKPTDLLPQCERNWEEGIPVSTPSLAVSETASIAASAFARTCQATDLLSRVLLHLNENHSGRESMMYWYQNAIHLHQILTSFNLAITSEFQTSTFDRPDEKLGLFSAMGICFSAQVALYDAHTCAEADHPEGVGIPEQLQIQNISLESMVRACSTIHEFTKNLCEILERSDDNPKIASFFVSDSLYAAARGYLWYWNDSMKEELLRPLYDIVNTLALLGERWSVGREYLSILKGEGLQEALNKLPEDLDGLFVSS